MEFMEERSFGQNRGLDIKVLRNSECWDPSSSSTRLQPHPGAPASWLPADTACTSLREALAPLLGPSSTATSSRRPSSPSLRIPKELWAHRDLWDTDSGGLWSSQAPPLPERSMIHTSGGMGPGEQRHWGFHG